MKVAAYQAPLLPAGSMAALELIRDRVKWCETEGSISCVVRRPCSEGLRTMRNALPISRSKSKTVNWKRCSPLSASQSVTVIVGFTEIVRRRNAIQCRRRVSRRKVVGIYRKRHPAIRRSVYSAGDQSPVFTVGPLSFGIMICNDSNYPDLAADLVARGARTIFVPSNNSLPPARADVVALSRAVDIARASDNEVMIVRADVAGRMADRSLVRLVRHRRCSRNRPPGGGGVERGNPRCGNPRLGRNTLGCTGF